MSKKYLKTVYDLGTEKLIYKTYSGGMFGDHRQRSAKTHESKRTVEEHNIKKTIFNLFLLLCANFHRGDWNITLTYRKGLRPDHDTSKNIVSDFFKRLKKWCAQQRRSCKYIWVTHIGAHGGIHHHVILPKWIPYDVLCDLWKYGQVQTGHPLYGNNEYQELASYLIRGTKGEQLLHSKGGRRYNPSHGLTRIEPQREWVEAGRWKREPKIPKGWYLKKGSLYNDVDIWGYPYQSYTLIRFPDLSERGWKSG